MTHTPAWHRQPAGYRASGADIPVRAPVCAPKPRLLRVGWLAKERCGLVFASLALLVFCSLAQAGPKKHLPSHRINLNRATLEQLEELPGVGPAMAHSILKFRQQSGPFQRVDDLLAIRGISRTRLAKIRPYVYVGKENRRANDSRQRPGKSATRGISASGGK